MAAASAITAPLEGGGGKTSSKPLLPGGAPLGAGSVKRSGASMRGAAACAAGAVGGCGGGGRAGAYHQGKQHAEYATSLCRTSGLVGACEIGMRNKCRQGSARTTPMPHPNEGVAVPHATALSNPQHWRCAAGNVPNTPHIRSGLPWPPCGATSVHHDCTACRYRKACLCDCSVIACVIA